MHIVTIFIPDSEEEAKAAQWMANAFTASGVRVSSGHDGPHGSWHVTSKLRESTDELSISVGKFYMKQFDVLDKKIDQ